jgi:hypothetical protein
VRKGPKLRVQHPVQTSLRTVVAIAAPCSCRASNLPLAGSAYTSEYATYAGSWSAHFEPGGCANRRVAHVPTARQGTV